jgi:hypothetical protein
MIITAIMATTALLEKPDRASCGASTPDQARASKLRMATTSMRTTSSTSMNTVPARMASTIRMDESMRKHLLSHQFARCLSNYT